MNAAGPATAPAPECTTGSLDAAARRRLTAAAAVLWAVFATGAEGQTNATDRAALEALYEAADGANWTDSTNWLTDAPLSAWFGVATDGAGRVTVLNLDRNALTGTVPAELGLLTELQGLYLGDNDLTGPIPDALGNLTNLQGLYLGDNALSGPLPGALGSLADLRSLRLGNNRLSGRLPDALGSLTSLEELHLHTNDFTGRIPDALGSLANLLTLQLHANDLTGPAPARLGDLARLRSLLLGPNRLTGTLPRELTRLSALDELVISDTGLCAPADDAFQAWLAALDNFLGDTCNRPPQPVGAFPAQTLIAAGPARDVSAAPYFSDPDEDLLTWSAASGDPRTVSAFVSGDTVWLVPGTAGATTVTVTARDPDGLSATQDIAVTTAAAGGPQSDREVLEALYDATGGADWANSTNWRTAAPLDAWHGVTTDAAGRVTGLELPENGLTGPLPPALGELADLEHLNLGGNALTGPIPDALGSLANLERLDLGRNILTGPIPAGLGRLARLQSLFLEWNVLTGPIPDALGGLANLEWLLLSQNALTGPIPDALGSLTNLEWLHLDWNALTGPIPGSLGRPANLRSLNLAANDLSGPIPGSFGRLANLEGLYLGGNDLTGPIPDALGSLANLRELSLGGTALSGPIPNTLGSLASLEWLELSYAWGLSGPLPAGLRSAASLAALDILATQACAPAALDDWLRMIDFRGRLCGAGTATIDVAVVHTPAAREAAGGAAAIDAAIDLMVAETNRAYEASGVRHRVALTGRAEVQYVEAGESVLDLERLADPSDGHMDEAHALRDRVGADLVHLIVDAERANVGGIAYVTGAFGLTVYQGGGIVFAHELGHNMALRHDRYQMHHYQDGTRPHPAYGYVNQPALAPGGGLTRRWRTIMAYGTQCLDAYTRCAELLRFSNPRQRHGRDLLGVPFGDGGSGATGPADAAAVLNVTGPAIARWRDRQVRVNRPPTAAGTLPDRSLAPGGALTVDVSRAFTDPDGDSLTYAVSSSAPGVVTVQAAGPRVTLTAVSIGSAQIRVTAADPGGLSAAQSFTVTVSDRPSAPFTDHPIRPGVTPVRAVHFTELRSRIDGLRRAAGLTPFGWTDPVLRAGVTPVRLVHLLELRRALGAAYTASGRPAPRWTDAAPTPGTTPIRAAHLNELRAAVVALE